MQFLFVLKDFRKMQDNAILPRFSTHLSNAKVGPGGFGHRQLTRPNGIFGVSGELSLLTIGRNIHDSTYCNRDWGQITYAHQIRFAPIFFEKVPVGLLSMRFSKSNPWEFISRSVYMNLHTDFHEIAIRLRKMS